MIVIVFPVISGCLPYLGLRDFFFLYGEIMFCDPLFVSSRVVVVVIHTLYSILLRVIFPV